MIYNVSSGTLSLYTTTTQARVRAIPRETGSLAELKSLLPPVSTPAPWTRLPGITWVQSATDQGPGVAPGRVNHSV